MNTPAMYQNKRNHENVNRWNKGYYNLHLTSRDKLGTSQFLLWSWDRCILIFSVKKKSISYIAILRENKQ